MMDDAEFKRYQAVKTLLASPAFREALDQIKDDIKEELVKADFKDRDKRDRLHLEHQLVERLEGILTAYAAKITMERKYG